MTRWRTQAVCDELLAAAQRPRPSPIPLPRRRPGTRDVLLVREYGEVMEPREVEITAYWPTATFEALVERLRVLETTVFKRDGEDEDQS